MLNIIINNYWLSKSNFVHKRRTEIIQKFEGSRLVDKVEEEQIMHKSENSK